MKKAKAYHDRNLRPGLQGNHSKHVEFMEVPKDGKTITREWNVLYTAQIMKKAKTYHDGILRVDVRGNHSKQAILYDIDRKQLDKKLIKKDEIVECGQSFKFDGHLVEIGDPLEDSNFLDALNSSQENCMKEFAEVPKGSSIKTGFQNDVFEKRSIASDQNFFHQITKEWNVLYTSQIMKKSKTYHDGILRLEVKGNHSNQVILYDIDRNPLDKKLIKKGEIIECGQLFKFDGHLVDIGEHVEATNFLHGLNSRPGNYMKEFVEVPKEPQHGAWIDCGPINLDFSPGEYKVEDNRNCMKPVRSVCQILQSLKRPMDLDSAAATGVDAITIHNDARVLKDTTKKLVEQEYVSVKSDFETLSQTREVIDDNVDSKAANIMEIDIRPTECTHDDEGIDDAVVVFRQVSPTCHKDSIFKGSASDDCCKPGLESALELEPHLNENSENHGPSFNLLF